MVRKILGGCLCKKIRYKAMVEPRWISICHCRMCQKAYGNTSATFVAFDTGNWQPNGIHLGIESKICWDIIHDNLPQYRTEEDPDFISASSSENTLIK